MEKTMADLVKENVQNSKDNGFDPDSLSDAELACDLYDMSSDFEDYTLEEVLRAVKEARGN